MSSGRIFTGTTTITLKNAASLSEKAKGNPNWNWDVQFRIPQPAAMDKDGRLVNMILEATITAWVDEAEKDLVTAECKREFPVSLDIVEEGPNWLVELFAATFNDCQARIIKKLEPVVVPPATAGLEDPRMMYFASEFAPQYNALFPFLGTPA